jgi:galactokinase
MPERRRVRVAAPGRVNLIGEHVDYHEGLVLPAAIDRFVVAEAVAREDDRVEIQSLALNAHHAFSLAQPFAGSGWAARVEGIVRDVLANVSAPRGLELTLGGDLPPGSGLSSSAASMVAAGLSAARLNGVEPEPLELARTVQQAEHRYAGVHCGIMDPLAVLLGREGCALRIDCRTLQVEPVPLPKAWALVVLDTHVRHELASSEYNRRQQECAAALAELGARSLRDVSASQLGRVMDPLALKRCRHVVAELLRVDATVEALRREDRAAIGALFAASHASLRDDYEVSCRELDAMVEAARGASGFIAGRMTGGGFGGATVNFVERDAADRFISQALARYRAATGRDGSGLTVSAGVGAQPVDIPAR